MNRDWKWPWGAAAFIAILYVASRQPVPGQWWLIPWALSLVFIGLPHGALDHEVVLRLWKPQPPPRWGLAAVIAGYLFLTALVMTAWFIAPVAVFVGFILLTLAHWGLGDLWWSAQRDPAYFTSRLHRLIFACERGALPMLLPLIVAPQVYRNVAESICQLFAGEPISFMWMESSSFRLLIFIFVILVVVTEILLANRRSPTFLLNLAETGGLALGFLVVPPLAAVGFYFVFWHGLRHVLRLMKMEQLSFARFTLLTTPATVGALALLVLLGFVLIDRRPSPSFLALYLALIASLTVPHSAVVTWMDRREGLY